jgi:hypothetical protein
VQKTLAVYRHELLCARISTEFHKEKFRQKKSMRPEHCSGLMLKLYIQVSRTLDKMFSCFKLGLCKYFARRAFPPGRRAFFVCGLALAVVTRKNPAETCHY